MVELTRHARNPMIDPAMHVWGWEIPVYLFLGGLVAGMMIISGYFLFSGRYANTDCSCYVCCPGSAVGCSAWACSRCSSTSSTSYMSGGSTRRSSRARRCPGAPGSCCSSIRRCWPTCCCAAPFAACPSSGLGSGSPTRLERVPNVVKWIGGANMLLGGMLGIYTGILLSALGARPLWSSALLGPLFLVSGLSAAAALVHMIARDREERELLAKADNGFLVDRAGADRAVPHRTGHRDPGVHMRRRRSSSAALHRGLLGLRRRPGNRRSAVVQLLAVNTASPTPRAPDPRAGRRPAAALRHRLRRPAQPLEPGLSGGGGIHMALSRTADRGRRWHGPAT